MGAAVAAFRGTPPGGWVSPEQHDDRATRLKCQFRVPVEPLGRHVDLPPCATRRFFDISGICRLFCVLRAIIRLLLALLQVAIRAGQSRRVGRLTEQLPRFSRLAFRPLQQLLQQPLQKCNSRESASASRHTRRKPSAKEKHCPWLKQAVSVPTMGVYHPRPTRSSRPTRRPNRTRRALASWRRPDPRAGLAV